MTNYRLGEFEVAIVQLEESIKLRGEAAGRERFVLPMALHAAGRIEEAKEAFDLAEQWRVDTVPDDPVPMPIRQEAAELMNIQTPSDQPSSQ